MHKLYNEFECTRVVVVSGASGFIGNICCSHFRELGYDVIKIGRSPAADIQCDFARPESVFRLRELPAFCSFVHLGAHVGWDGSSIEDMFSSNIISTALIADLVRERKSHLIFASAALIAGLHTEKISSTTLDNPDCAYASSKLIAEECINASGADAIILRIGGVYGYNGPHHLGLNRNIQSALLGNVPVIFGSGSGLRNYIYVKDLVTIIAQVVKLRSLGTELVAGAEVLSIYDMYRLICEVFELDSGPVMAEGYSSRSQVIITSSDFAGKSSFIESLSSIYNSAPDNP